MPHKDKKAAREYQRVRGQRRRQDRRALLAKAKSGPCADCGKRYPPVVMDFDHRPGERKFLHVSGFATSVSDELVLREIAKCDLVCANCHRIRTFTRGSK